MATCEAMNPDGSVRCALKPGHEPVMDDGTQFDHAAPSLGVWWCDPPAPAARRDESPRYPNGVVARVANGEGFDQPCTATDGEYQCSYPTGHAELTWSGNTYAHAHGDRDGAVVAAWNPEPPVFCPVRSPHGDGCTLAGGHPGMHERHFAGERMASWSDPPTARTCPANLPDAHRGQLTCTLPEGHGGEHRDPDGARWRVSTNGERRAVGLSAFALPEQISEAAPPEQISEAALLDAMAQPRSSHPVPFQGRPVRVRLVGLPHSSAFALVVDRFRDAAHFISERLMWSEIGKRLGAVTTICYPDELDVYTPE